MFKKIHVQKWNSMTTFPAIRCQKKFWLYDKMLLCLNHCLSKIVIIKNVSLSYQTKLNSKTKHILIFKKNTIIIRITRIYECIFEKKLKLIFFFQLIVLSRSILMHNYSFACFKSFNQMMINRQNNRAIIIFICQT